MKFVEVRFEVQMKFRYPFRSSVILQPCTPHTVTCSPLIPSPLVSTSSTSSHHQPTPLIMASLFKKANKKPSPEQVIGTMKNTIETLDKRIDFLEHKIKNEENEARRFMAAKNKRGMGPFSLLLSSSSFLVHTHNHTTLPHAFITTHSSLLHLFLTMSKTLTLSSLSFSLPSSLLFPPLLFSPLFTAAIVCLKKKKMMEGQIEKLTGASMTMHTQLDAIESAKVSSEVLSAMQQGSNLMKEQTKHMYVG